MTTASASIKRVIFARMNHGDDVLESIRNAVAKEGVRSGLILSGVGSVTRYRVHVVETTNMPPGDIFFGEDGPYDILSITGLVLEGRVHAHITLSNTDKALGGHLEEGCRILTFGVVTIAETPDASLADWDKLGTL